MLCEGENLDINYQESPLVKIDQLIEMIKKRSGSIYGCCLQLAYLAMNSADIDDNLLHHLELDDDKENKTYKNNQYIVDYNKELLDVKIVLLTEILEKKSK